MFCRGLVLALAAAFEAAAAPSTCGDCTDSFYQCLRVPRPDYEPGPFDSGAGGVASCVPVGEAFCSRMEELGGDEYEWTWCGGGGTPTPRPTPGVTCRDCPAEAQCLRRDAGSGLDEPNLCVAVTEDVCLSQTFPGYSWTWCGTPPPAPAPLTCGSCPADAQCLRRDVGSGLDEPNLCVSLNEAVCLDQTFPGYSWEWCPSGAVCVAPCTPRPSQKPVKALPEDGLTPRPTANPPLAKFPTPRPTPRPTTPGNTPYPTPEAIIIDPGTRPPSPFVPESCADCPADAPCFERPNWVRAVGSPVANTCTAKPRGECVTGGSPEWRREWCGPPGGTTPISLCADDPGWSKRGEPGKTCAAWVAANPARCSVKDADAVYAFEGCKATCGACARCEDDGGWHKAGDPSKNCAWAKRFINRCAVDGADGRKGYEACRMACKACDPCASVGFDASLCGDDPAWHKNGAPAKDCAFVAANPLARCSLKGAGGVWAFQREGCPMTCGACTARCEDDASWYKRGGPRSKSCAWVKRFINRCAVDGADGRKGYEACPFACGTCQAGHAC